MEEYIEALLGQIRHKQARAAVEEEIRQHISDQADAYRASGSSQEEAVRKAVADMGDPVETGVALDCIHRPQMAWGIIFLVSLLSCLSILLQLVIGRNDAQMGTSQGMHHMINVAFGFGMMLLIYRIDYSIIGKYAEYAALAFLLLLFVGIFFIGYTLNGARAWLIIPGGYSLSLPVLANLYVPLYAGILYKQRGSGYAGVAKCLLWLAAPVCLLRYVPAVFAGITLIFMMALLFSLAVLKGWFRIPKLKFLAAFWGVLLCLPAFGIFLALWFGLLTSYQEARLRNIFAIGAGEMDYITLRIREYINNSRFFGNSGNVLEGFVPSYESGYIMTFVASYYGIAAAVLLFAAVLYIAMRMFRISARQKNQLGMIMGCGCGLVLAVHTIMQMLSNFGSSLSMRAWTWMPFFSYGGTSVVVSYILLGIVLSIYRYKELLPAYGKKAGSQPGFALKD